MRMRILVVLTISIASLLGVGRYIHRAPGVPGVLPPSERAWEVGREAILWDREPTADCVLLMVAPDRRRAATPDIGSRVMFLGELPDLTPGGRREARVKVLDGDCLGVIGFVALDHLRPIER